MTRQKLWTEIGLYAGLCLASLLVLFRALRLDRADLSVPFGYVGGDAFSVAMAFKGIVENGWYLRNPALGAPFGQELHDYPSADALNFFLVKVLGWVVPDWGAVMNLVFLLGFPLVAAVAFAVFRALGLKIATSGALSLLYTFLPYHFWRGESHIFLGLYHLVPLISLLALRLWEGNPPFFGPHRRREAAWLGLACLAIGSSGVYYAYFGCFFFVVAAFSSYMRDRGRKAVLSAALLIGLTVAGVAISLTPTWAYHLAHGKNSWAVVRSPEGAEVFALKGTQLIIPVDGHRIGALAEMKSAYNLFPLPNENTAMLGLVGAVGFIGLLLRRLRLGGAAGDLTDRLSILNLGALMLATVGSLGGFLALVLGLGIRSYNRISVFIAFFALLAVGILIDRARLALETSRARRLIGRLSVAAILVLGFLDQVPPSFKPQYAEARAGWVSDRTFVREVEAALPPGAMIYQLPYVPFPEPERQETHGLGDYDLLRGYLQSSRLRWSFGAMKGRGGDLWLRDMAGRPLPEQLERAAAAGFRGVYVARRGFPDGGAAVDRELADLAGGRPIVSPDGTLAFHDLGPYRERLEMRLGPAGWNDLIEKSLALVQLWTDGCYGLEGDARSNWRWCGRTGTLRIHNYTTADRTLVLEARIEGGSTTPAALRVTGPDFQDDLALTKTPVAYARTFTARPGDTFVRFRSEGPRVEAPADSRYLVFRVLDARLQVGDSR